MCGSSGGSVLTLTTVNVLVSEPHGALPLQVLTIILAGSRPVGVSALARVGTNLDSVVDTQRQPLPLYWLRDNRWGSGQGNLLRRLVAS